jgi:hypothetical protein
MLPAPFDYCTIGSAILVRYSTSYKSNVEVVDIPKDLLISGETICAKVSHWVFSFDPCEDDRFFYYAIGWTWVQDQAQ